MFENVSKDSKKCDFSGNFLKMRFCRSELAMSDYIAPIPANMVSEFLEGTCSTDVS
jgi:hypothetical protein